MNKNPEKEEFEKSLGTVPHIQFIGILACSCNSKRNVRVETSMEEVTTFMTCSICGREYQMTAGKFIPESEVESEKEEDD